MYNMVNGTNPSTFFILPMLEKHPDEYPRYRDCFAEYEDKPAIQIYTRTGGGNRQEYQAQIDELKKHPLFMCEFDDEDDSTYMTFVFNVPEKFKEDYSKIVYEGDAANISNDYLKMLYKVYPKLSEKWDLIKFKREEVKDDIQAKG